MRKILHLEQKSSEKPSLYFYKFKLELVHERFVLKRSCKRFVFPFLSKRSDALGAYMRAKRGSGDAFLSLSAHATHPTRACGCFVMNASVCMALFPINLLGSRSNAGDGWKHALSSYHTSAGILWLLPLHLPLTLVAEQQSN
jgi:hypothetical protein